MNWIEGCAIVELHVMRGRCGGEYCGIRWESLGHGGSVGII